MQTKVTIILCVLNGDKFLDELLHSIFCQKADFRAELIVVDSGSKDKSLEILKNFQFKISNLKSAVDFRFLNIRPRSFFHGKTRNKLVKMAKGELVVFVSQDIQIPNNQWLVNLIRPFTDRETAGVFCRQKPRFDANVYDKFFYQNTYPDKNFIIHTDNPKLGISTIFFSMVCGAMRRNLLLKYPFVQNKDWAIDQWWAKSVLEKHLKIFYTRDTFVYHSHNYSWREVWQRNFLLGKSLKWFPKTNLFMSIACWLNYVFREIKEVGGRERVGVLFYELWRLAAFIYGGVIGAKLNHPAGGELGGEGGNHGVQASFK